MKINAKGCLHRQVSASSLLPSNNFIDTLPHSHVPYFNIVVQGEKWKEQNGN